MDRLSDHIKIRYCHMGLRDKDHFTLKSYVPLTLVNQKEFQTEQETTKAVYLRIKGNIDEIPQTIDAKKLTGITEIFDSMSGKIPNVILIEGHSGIGKTTFVKEICIKWAKGKLLKSNKLVLLLLLRDPNVQKISDEKKLIEHFTKHFTTEICNDLVKNGGANVTLIIDGFNELSTELRKESFFTEIIEKKVLPCATVLVTSRPSASVCLHNLVSRRIEILGFDQSSRKQYVTKALQNSPFKLEKLNGHFKQYPNIDAICHIPLIMSIIVFLCMCQPDDLPQTATKMYRSFILHTIKRYLKNTEGKIINKPEDLPQVVHTTLQELNKVAFNGLIEDKMIFTVKELVPVCTYDSTCFGLLQDTMCYGVEGTLIQSFNFLHLGIQEYFAAEYITTLPEDKVYALLKKSFIVTNNSESVRLSNMWILYCGITSGQSKTLRHYLTTYGKSNDALPVKECITTTASKQINNNADSQVTSKVMTTGPSQQGSSSDHSTINISLHILNDPVKILYLFQCFQEAQDNVLCEVLSKSFDNGVINISSHRLLPFQVMSLGFFLSKSCRKWEELNLSDCHINDHCLHQLLCGEKLNEQEIKNIVLCNNSLTEASSHHIARIMIYLEKLYINNNKLGDHGASLLSKGIEITKTLQLLDISNNNIGSSGTTAIANALANNTSLKELFMEGNEVGQDGAIAIAEAITNNKTLKTLYINNNKLGDHGAGLLSIGIANNKTLQLLNISNNNIGSSGTTAIANALANNIRLEELFMEGNEVGQDGATAIAEAITINKTLKTLLLDDNIIDNDSVMKIIESVNKNDIITKISLPCTPEYQEVIKEEIMKINMDRKERRMEILICYPFD